jgi:peptidoglycan/LPS O-acetylase OafA/YrhL
MLVTAPYLPLPRIFSASFLPPAFYWTAMGMALFCVSVVFDRPKLIINRFIGRIGVVSYSVYLWHWGVLAAFRSSSLAEFLYTQDRVAALVAWVIAFFIVTLVTFCLAVLSYRYIERPGIQLGKYLSMHRGLSHETHSS